MRRKIPIIYIVVSSIFMSCQSGPEITIKNEKKGNLKATKRLEITEEKQFPLDSLSAPRPPYIEIFSDSSGDSQLAMLSGFSKNIFIYNYDSSNSPVHKIPIGNVQIPLAFHIKNMDSIYVYNDQFLEMDLLNNKSEIVSKISLVNSTNLKDLAWTFKYPQYMPHSVNKMIEHEGKLIFPGQYIWSIPDTIVKNFKFATAIDMNSNQVSFLNKYPYDIYGHGYVWDEPIYTNVYYHMTPDNKKMICSFPVSHDLFIYDMESNKEQVVYGGGNGAENISSMDPAQFKSKTVAPKEYIYRQSCKSDLYAGILYDKYRKVYYRFLRKGIPDGARFKWENKKVNVIVMDENFNYLGETEIGDMNEFYPDNSFVTKEGLNIEYVDPNDVKEEFLRFKIFALKNI